MAEALFGAPFAPAPERRPHRPTAMLWVVPAIILVVAGFLALLPRRVDSPTLPQLADSPSSPANILRVARLRGLQDLNFEVISLKRNLFQVTTFDWTNGGHSPLGTHSLPSAQTNRIML